MTIEYLGFGSHKLDRYIPWVNTNYHVVLLAYINKYGEKNTDIHFYNDGNISSEYYLTIFETLGCGGGDVVLWAML